MEHYKIEAISDILTRSDLGNTRADFADLVEQFEALKTARNEQAAQLELDLKKTRAEAFALLDSVPYLSDWIAEKTGSAAVDLSEVITNYLNDDVDFNQIVSDQVDLDDLANDFAITAVDSYIENYVDFDELAREAINDLSISIRVD